MIQIGRFRRAARLRRRSCRTPAHLLSFSVTLAACGGEQIPPVPLEVTYLATLDTTEGAPIQDPMGVPTVVSDPAGRYFVAPVDEIGIVAVYRPDGTYEQIIHRPPPSPNTVPPITRIAVAGDTLYVDDFLRLWALDSSGAVLWSNMQPRSGLTTGLAVMGNHLAQARATMEPGAPNLSLHRRDGTAGAEQRSRWAADDGPSPRHVVGPGGGGHYWVAPINRYELEARDTSGKVLQRLRRTVPWFQPWALGTIPLNGPEPPAPLMRAVRNTASGWLLVLVHVADSAYVPYSLSEPAEGEMRRMPTLMEEAGLYDTRLELLHPTTGKVHASVRLPGVLHGLVNDSTAFALREAEGKVVIDLWRLRPAG